MLLHIEYFLVVNDVPGLFNDIFFEDDNPAVKYNGAVSDKTLPIVKTIEVIIPLKAIGNINFLIVSNFVLPNA